MSPARALLALLVCVSCSGEPSENLPDPPQKDPPARTPTPTEAARYGEPLDAPRLLRRISLDLLGVLPTEDQLRRVTEDPTTLETITDELLNDPRLEDRFVALLNERWLTRVDAFNLEPWDYGLSAEQTYPFLRSIGEEPLRIAARVLVEDQPWSEVVTANWTMANEITAEIFPIQYPEGGEGWQVSYYTDGRPAGGVLMTNGLWWRYYTTPNNFSRSRAAALSRLFLCEDFLLRPISFESPALLDRESLNAAIREEEACAGCHSALDPLASALFGFWWFDLYDPTELSRYHTEREQLGVYYLETDPAWFGTPLQGAVDLGPTLAADPRFKTCAVRTFAELLWRRGVDVEDLPTLETLRAGFVAADQRPKALLRLLLAGPEYRVGSLTDDAPDEVADRLSTARLMSADQLATAIEDLTGFTWTLEGWDQLDNDEVGYRVLLGGVDGVTVTSPLRDPALSRVLALKRLAQGAGAAVAAADLHPEATTRTLLGEVTRDSRPGDAVFTAQLQALSWRLYAVPLDADRQAELEALWTAVAAEDGSERMAELAWASVLSVMIRDPRFEVL